MHAAVSMLQSSCGIVHQIAMKFDRNSQCVSAHVVPDDEVKQAIAQNIVSKGPLWRPAFKIMIAGVDLHSQTHCRDVKAHVRCSGCHAANLWQSAAPTCENKEAYAAGHPSQEGVEWEGSHKKCVGKLQADIVE